MPPVKPLLTETEDRLFAMADDEWMDLATAKAILESWFAAPFSAQEVGNLLAVLLERGFVSCTVKAKSTTAATFRFPEDLAAVEFKATESGLQYISENDGKYGA